MVCGPGSKGDGTIVSGLYRMESQSRGAVDAKFLGTSTIERMKVIDLAACFLLFTGHFAGPTRSPSIARLIWRFSRCACEGQYDGAAIEPMERIA